jgi:hypothetical protein
MNEDYDYEHHMKLLDIIDKFMMHLGFAVHKHDIDHFIDLFTPKFFNEIPQEEKFNSGIMAIGSIQQMQEKYLHRFIFDTNISESTLDDISDENHWRRAGFDIEQIRSMFSLRELKHELPVNATQNKKPKV